MTDHSIPSLYQRFFIDKQDERKQLFLKLAQKHQPSKGLYPGSFVHITPSMFIRDMTYIDMDRRMKSFFEDEKVSQFLEEHKTYTESPIVSWYMADYAKPLPIEENSFDIMFSFYAGFISRDCKKYLKPEGFLICNNSHGDSTLAFLDDDYVLTGVIKRRGENFTISENDLDTYFIKKDGTRINKEKVLEKMTGEHYTKSCFAYIFQYLPT
nr:hypothetical protein [uncultured Sphaerochaeta sp.]